MSMGNFFKKAPTIRPLLNVGCLLDIPTGRYRKGPNGENILNGGLSYVTGIAGMGNTFKSTLAHYMVLRALDRYKVADANVYDTEISLTMDRLHQLGSWMDNIGGTDLDEEGRVTLSDKTTQTGNEWFESFKNYNKEKRKDVKKQMIDTPFIDKDGKKISALRPDLFEIDSLSQMDTEAVLTMMDKNEIGSSGLNMEAMKGAAAKSQMLNQMPGLTGSSGSYLLMTAHIGEVHQLDPYAPPKKQLGFLKGKLKFKNVPEKFSFLTNNCWFVIGAKPLQNASSKCVEYPRNKEDNMVGDTDLNVMTVTNLRGKGGASGQIFELMVSQSEGILVGLSEFNYIKGYGRYGLGGHDRNYYLELTPDISMMRTTVRGKINEHANLRRALEITSEMCQMNNYWSHLPQGLVVEPKELYEGLKSKGYDWDVLLDTRGYWVFDGCDEGLPPFLSTMDLLEMYHGRYQPWWYNKIAKEKGLQEIKA